MLSLIPFVGGTFNGNTLATSLGNLAIGTAIALSVEFSGSSAYQSRRVQS